MTPFDDRKLLLEPLDEKQGLFIPELPPSPEVSEEAIRNELMSLRRSYDHLLRQMAALQARNDELDAYAYTVAHDLKNPLAVVLMTSEALTNIDNLTPGELHEFVEQIQTTALEMDDIIDNLLLLSEVREAEVPLQSVDMAEVVAHIRNRLGYLIKARHARVSFPKAWPVAVGYAPWIEEVWANYLSNALKYGGEPPAIELDAAAQPDGMIRFWVRDHGRGLTPTARGRLFTPFTRVDQAHRPGHGLGLSIVRRIIEKLGGEVGVESARSRGSLFYFTLPADQQTAAPHAHAREGRSFRSIRIWKEVPAGKASNSLS